MEMCKEFKNVKCLSWSDNKEKFKVNVNTTVNTTFTQEKKSAFKLEILEMYHDNYWNWLI